MNNHIENLRRGHYLMLIGHTYGVSKLETPMGIIERPNEPFLPIVLEVLDISLPYVYCWNGEQPFWVDTRYEKYTLPTKAFIKTFKQVSGFLTFKEYTDQPPPIIQPNSAPGPYETPRIDSNTVCPFCKQKMVLCAKRQAIIAPKRLYCNSCQYVYLPLERNSVITSG